jgi:hypothetical protein
MGRNTVAKTLRTRTLKGRLSDTDRRTMRRAWQEKSVENRHFNILMEYLESFDLSLYAADACSIIKLKVRDEVYKELLNPIRWLQPRILSLLRRNPLRGGKPTSLRA